jgi:hypothetical protein
MEPTLRNREYVSFRAEQLLEENRRLNLPALGGFVRSFVDLEASADRESQLSRVRTARYSSLYVVLGLPAAVLAAIAGVTVLASTAGRLAAGIIALTAAALSAAATFLDSAKKRDQAAKLNTDWEDLYSEMRVCRLTKLASFTTLDGPAMLTSFAARAAAIRAGRDSTRPRASATPNAESRPLFIRIPNMVGWSLSRVEETMMSDQWLLLEVNVMEDYPPSRFGKSDTVVKQSVCPGTPVPEGTTVILDVSPPPRA